MNKHTITIGTHFLRGAFFLSLFLFLQVLPLALGQPEPIDGNGPSQATPTPTPCNSPYVITTITATIVPGTTDIGNNGDDSVTTIALPFPYTLYDMSFTSINLSSNGNAQFVTAATDFTNVCLPWTTHNYTIFPYWEDLYLVNSGFGIFTSVSGTAPNRIFNIEWRAQYFPGSGTANFELRLYEGQTRFDLIYGTLTNGNTSATAGVQRDDTVFSQYFCNGTGGAATGGQSYILQPCATPTPAPVCPGWLAGPDLPAPLVRAAGIYFPADGNFYSVGGRSSDAAGSDFQHVLRYSPTTNTWTQMGATLPDPQVNNMACGVLTLSSTPLIYCVGGSAAGQTTATARVFFYSPVTDTVANLGSDDWPGDAAGTILPGGFAVVSNKLYILGGFNINVASTNQIWQFDPTAAAGSRWTQKVNTPEGIMFAPTCAIGGIIYVGGASDFAGGTVIDTTNSFSFDPATNTIGTIAAIPRAAGETRALNFNGQMWVLGGGRVAPNPSNEVDIYNPGSNTWTTGLPFTTARRNFPADTDGSTSIWLAGGYGSAGTPLSSMELFCSGAPKALNISTRLRVQTGDNVLIGGFIITGSAPKTVAVRGIGPSLSAFGVPDPLANPTLELRASNGTLIVQNDNWQDDPLQAAQLTALGLAPTDPHESGLIATLNPNASYTAVLSGSNGGTGVGLVEAYDTNSTADSQLANISTRGFVETGAGVMIGGFILGGSSNAQVALRGIGPSLTQFGVPDALADPTLELHDSNGMLLVANDNWQDDPTSAGQLTAHGLAPSDPLESGIFTSLPPGGYTAILAGKNDGTGVGLVEIYNVQ
jgi:hypothetical protein